MSLRVGRVSGIRPASPKIRSTIRAAITIVTNIRALIRSAKAQP